MSTPITVLIFRGDQWATSYDMYAKVNYSPLEMGDGIFAGNAPIDPWQSSTSFTWTPPVDATWHFSACAKYQDRIGPLGVIQ